MSEWFIETNNGDIVEQLHRTKRSRESVEGAFAFCVYKSTTGG